MKAQLPMIKPRESSRRIIYKPPDVHNNKHPHTHARRAKIHIQYIYKIYNLIQYINYRARRLNSNYQAAHALCAPWMMGIVHKIFIICSGGKIFILSQREKLRECFCALKTLCQWSDQFFYMRIKNSNTQNSIIDL